MFTQHVEGCCVFELSCLLEKVSCHAFVRIDAKTGSVHVTEVDHRIAVLKLMSVEEVLIGFFVAFLDKVRNAI